MNSTILQVSGIIGEITAGTETSNSRDTHNLDLYDNKYLREVNQLHNLTYYRNLRAYSGNNRFTVFFQRVIRKMLSFLILPILEQQNAFNYAVAECINDLYVKAQNKK